MRAPSAKRVSRRLARVRPGQQRVVSCYVRLTPEDRTRRKYWRDVKAAVDEQGRQLATGGHGRRGIERDLQRVLDFVGDPANLPHTPGFALFVCSPIRLFAVVPLPSVARTRVVVDKRPLLDELSAAEREFGEVAAVVLDRERARFFSVDAFGADELASLRSPARRGGRFHSDRRDSPGWGEHDYHNRIREERHRHYASVAERLAALMRERPIEGIVLAGPGNVPEALRRFLPASLGDKVMGVARLNPKLATTAHVAAAVLAARAEHMGRYASELVRTAEEGLGTGWAVTGRAAVLAALATGRARQLLIEPDVNGAGFRCGTTGRLVEAAGDCRGEGLAQPVPDLVGAMVHEAHRQHVPVTVLPAGAATQALDGVAALLRFR